MTRAIAASTLAGALLCASASAWAQPAPGAIMPAVAQALPLLDYTAALSLTAQGPGRRRGQPPRLPGAEPAARLRLSGHVGFTTFTASDTFEAVLGTSSGPVYGGGIGVLIGRRLFVDVQVSRFGADGERVFVTDTRQVFPLGIPTRVTTTPVDISAGWRFAAGPGRAGTSAPLRRRSGFRPVPFVGGGLGLLQYDERAEFAEAGDDVSDSFGSYHVLGGVELPFTRRIGASVDALYRWVPDAIGDGGASAVFGDTDLGGLTVRVRATFTF